MQALVNVNENNVLFIAFRGTDATLLGWYEDFNMLLMDEVPAQNSASNYLKEIANKIVQFYLLKIYFENN